MEECPKGEHDYEFVGTSESFCRMVDSATGALLPPRINALYKCRECEKTRRGPYKPPVGTGPI